MSKLRMNPLQSLFCAQFLSAFVDNMIFFICIAILKRDGYDPYYLPLVQCTFFIAFIILSPWVGRFADKKAKSLVLIVGNIVKACGVLSLMAGINPALSYAIVGAGAVIYSPAKYGILPLLTRNETELLQANSKLESSTILAILTGSIAGGFLADKSIFLALLVCIILYLCSVLVNYLIPRDSGNPSIRYVNATSELFRDLKVLLGNNQSHFALIGTGSFWMASSVLRLIIVVWLPITLGIVREIDKSMIIALTGVGIVIGAIITPYIVSIKTYYRCVWFGLALALCVLSFVFVTNLALTITLMMLVGIFGGIYIVPMNASLQEVGHKSIGTGKTVAIQNFVENSFMFLGSAAFTISQYNNIPLNVSILTIGTVLLAMVLYLVFYIKGKFKSLISVK